MPSHTIHRWCRLAWGFFTVSGLCVALLAHASTEIAEMNALLPAEPHLPVTVCATLLARLQQVAFRLPDSVDADPAHSSPDGQRLQAAIDACPAGQSVKLVASGANNAFLSGPLTIQSGVTLWIDGGVTLFASRSPRDYDVGSGADAGYCGTADAQHMNGCKAWISAIYTVSSGVVGDGVLDGRGGAVLTSGAHANQVTWWDLSIQSKANPPLQQNNPRLLNIVGGSHFTLYRITLTNSAKFHVGTNDANDFMAWGIKLVTPSLAYSVPDYACTPGTTPQPGVWKASTCFQPENVKNTDGIDPGNSSHVTVAHSFISTGDDHIAIKSGGGASHRATSAHQLFAHNHLYYGHGLSIGSETDNGVQDVAVWDLSIDGQDSPRGIGIRIKSDHSRGGEVKQVLYRHICMRRVAQPMVFDPNYGNTKDKGLIPDFHDITLQDVHVTGRYASTQNGGTVVFGGYKGRVTRPAQITLNNVYFDVAPTFQNQPYHDLQFSLEGGTNLKPPAADQVVINQTPGSAAPLACPDAVFSTFPSPISPF